jgi:aminopeptidase N
MNNANQDNLWHELTIQGHKDYSLDLTLNIKTIMDTWTLKMGYPVVYIIKHVDLTNNSTYLLISQKWFLLNPMSKFYKQPKIYDTYKWFVPFTYTTKYELNFEFESKPFWIKPNDNVGNLRGVFIFCTNKYLY